MKKTMNLVASMSFVIFLLSACGNVEKVEHIEVYMAETMERNDVGHFENTGYKKVNAITTIEEGKNYLKTEVKAIEDYYDTAGKYIKTEVKHSTFNKSLITLVEDENTRSEELQEASTILLPKDHLKIDHLDNLTKVEQEKVKEHVQSFIDRL